MRGNSPEAIHGQGGRERNAGVDDEQGSVLGSLASEHCHEVRQGLARVRLRPPTRRSGQKGGFAHLIQIGFVHEVLCAYLGRAQATLADPPSHGLWISAQPSGNFWHRQHRCSIRH